MKKLEIVVRSEKLDDVKSILDECESTGAMVSNIMGYGNQKGYKTTYRGSEYVVNLIPKVKIETFAADDVADKIIFKVCERNWQAVAFVHCLFFIVQRCLPVSSADSPGSSLYTT